MGALGIALALLALPLFDYRPDGAAGYGAVVPALARHPRRLGRAGLRHQARELHHGCGQHLLLHDAERPAAGARRARDDGLLAADQHRPRRARARGRDPDPERDRRADARLRLPLRQGHHRRAAHQRRRALADGRAFHDPAGRRARARENCGHRAGAVGGAPARAAAGIRRAGSARREGAAGHRRAAHARRADRRLVAVLGASGGDRKRHARGRDGRHVRCWSKRPRTRSTSSAATRACGRRISCASCATSRRAPVFPRSASGSAAITSGRMPGAASLRTRRWRRPPTSCASTSRRAFARSTSTARWPAAAIAEPLAEEIVAQRAASLAAAAEAAWREAGGEAPVYVIGTEVPTPGGATEDLATLAVTTPQAAAATIEAHRAGVRPRRARGGLAARGRARRPAGRRVRPSQGHRLPAAGGESAERVHRPAVAVRLRGALHRLPVGGRRSRRWCATTSRS